MTTNNGNGNGRIYGSFAARERSDYGKDRKTKHLFESNDGTKFAVSCPGAPPADTVDVYTFMAHLLVGVKIKSNMSVSLTGSLKSSETGGAAGEGAFVAGERAARNLWAKYMEDPNALMSDDDWETVCAIAEGFSPAFAQYRKMLRDATELAALRAEKEREEKDNGNGTKKRDKVASA